MTIFKYQNRNSVMRKFPAFISFILLAFFVVLSADGSHCLRLHEDRSFSSSESQRECLLDEYTGRTTFSVSMKTSTKQKRVVRSAEKSFQIPLTSFQSLSNKLKDHESSIRVARIISSTIVLRI